MKKRMTKMVGCSALVLAGFTVSAQAAQDWSSVSTSVTEEITAVMPVALTIFGAIIAVAIGKKVFQKIAG
jgi:Na+-translocating ferredoxin:NAD+ oxidoreductase RnfD subunit